MSRQKISFHKLVGNIPSLLLLIKLKKNGNVIGVYSKNGISSKGIGNNRADKGFIFSCRSASILKPVQKYKGKSIMPYSPDQIEIGNGDIVIRVE